MGRVFPHRSLAIRLTTVAAALAVAALIVGCGVSRPTAPPGSSPTAPASSPASLPPGSSSPSPSASPAAVPFDADGLSISLERVVDGLDAPLAAVNAGDGSGRIFVAEQGGTIRIVRNGALADGAFLDVAGRITSGGEQGLLGVAFHPDYPTDPRFFVDYTDINGDTRVSSFTVDPSNPDRADPGSETRILFVDQPYANHNGGALAFGPDGFLYIATGDGGSGGDPHGNGQSLGTLLGKILRIDIDRTDGTRKYAIPPDNPFVSRAGAEPEIWLYGLRNPWRMSFDRLTGDLWIGDVGQNAWEEVDVARAAAGGGANYGWNVMEGNHCFRPANGCDEAGLTQAVADYSHDSGRTVIGGGVYRGSEQAALAGGYLFADFYSGLVWALDPSSDGPTKATQVGESGASISSFGEDEAGELYVTDLSAGTLLRVTASRR
jgi:glucose/arabinose dehydrogenase